MNAGLYLSRRNLKEMPKTTLFYEWSKPNRKTYRRFRPRSRELSVRQDYETAQANQLCGRLEAKLQHFLKNITTCWEEDNQRQQMQLKETWIISVNCWIAQEG